MATRHRQPSPLFVSDIRHRRVQPMVHTLQPCSREYSKQSRPLTEHVQRMCVIQLVYLQFPSTLLPFVIGLAISAFYSSSLTLPLPWIHSRPLSAFRIPLSLYFTLQKVLLPLIGESPPPRRSDRTIPDEITPGMRAQRAAAMEARANASVLGQLLAVRTATLAAAGAAAGQARNTTTEQEPTGGQQRSNATRGREGTAGAARDTSAGQTSVPSSPLDPSPRSSSSRPLARFGGLFNSVTGLGTGRAGAEDGGESIRDGQDGEASQPMAPTEQNIQE